jgi:hypothetical protein
MDVVDVDPGPQILAVGTSRWRSITLKAQGVKERSVLTDRSLKETNPARESATKRAACSCPRGGAPAIPCGACVDGMTCTGNNRTPVRNAC